MGMGLVSDKDLEKELNNLSKSPSPDFSKKGSIVEPLDKKPGRNEGDNNVPSSLRSIISETSQIDGRKEALALAASMGISASSVSAYNKNVTSTDFIGKPDKTDARMISHTNRIKKNISVKARRVLNRALINIDDNKLNQSTATELANVAKSMSSIVKDMEPAVDQSERANQPSIVIFAPQVRNEQSFEFINISE